MTSMQLRPHPVSERHPLADQVGQFLRLIGMLLRQQLEQYNLIVEQLAIGMGQLSRCRHLNVAGQGLSAENDVLVGFGWGHGDLHD